jgi:hypothetical protein
LRRQDGLSATGRKGDCRAAFNVARQKCGRRHVNGSGSVRFRPVIQTHAGGNLKKSLVIALLAVAVASIGALTFAGDDAPVHRSVQALTSATAQISNLGMHTIPVSAHADKPSGAAPRIPCGTGTTGIFYGINGHVRLPGVYTNTSYAVQLSQLRDLGIALYRQDVSDEGEAQMVARLAQAAKAQCVGVFVVLTPDAQGNPDESAAYQQGYRLGHDSAMTLKGLVQYYEVGNEYDNDAILDSRSGDQPSVYDKARFVKARGAIRGMIDGVRSADPSAKIILCGLSWLHFGFSDMLHTGTQPDGSGGHPIPQWNITAWHWYSDMRDITCVGVRAPGGVCLGVDVLQHLKSTYGKPIWITEFGVRPDNTEDDAGTFLVGKNALGGFVENAQKYDIQSVELYELYDDQDNGGDGNYGVITNNGTTRKGRYDQVREFIRAHPDPWSG